MSTVRRRPSQPPVEARFSDGGELVEGGGAVAASARKASSWSFGRRRLRRPAARRRWRRVRARDRRPQRARLGARALLRPRLRLHDHAADRRARRRRRRDERAPGRRDARRDLVDVRRLRVAHECDRDRPAPLSAAPPRRNGRVPRHRARHTERVRGDRPRLRAGIHGRRPAPRGYVREGHVGLRGGGHPSDRSLQPRGRSDGAAGRRGGRATAGRSVGGRRAAPLVHALAHEHRGLRDRSRALLRAARPRHHRRSRRVDRGRRRGRGGRPARSPARSRRVALARPERRAVVAVLPRRERSRARNGRQLRPRGVPASRSSASATGTTGCCSASSRWRPA